MIIDPVCTMKIDDEAASGKAEYHGETYYFCSSRCKEAFEKDPDRWLRK